MAADLGMALGVTESYIVRVIADLPVGEPGG